MVNGGAWLFVDYLLKTQDPKKLKSTRILSGQGVIPTANFVRNRIMHGLRCPADRSVGAKLRISNHRMDRLCRMKLALRQTNIAAAMLNKVVSGLP